VHLACKADGERVALKVLRPHIVGDDEARARLAREVSSLSRIRSRWVAEIVDADPWGPVPFIATRYVPGFSLHDQVQERPRIAAYLESERRWPFNEQGIFRHYPELDEKRSRKARAGD